MVVRFSMLEPLNAVSTVSNVLPVVSTVSAPVLVGVNVYHTDAPPPSLIGINDGSLVSTVAFKFESVSVPVVVGSNSAAAK